MRNATIAAGLVAGLVRLAEKYGEDASSLCQASGIHQENLDNPDARIELDAYLQLFELARHKLDRPALAVEYGASIGMSEISIVGLLMEASKTIGDAYVQMRRYGQLAMQVDANADGTRFELAIEGNRLFLVDQLAPADKMKVIIESGFAWLVCGPRRYMDRSPVVGIEFTWSKPDYADHYEAIFRCPITYGASRNALEMHPEALSWPVGQNPAYVFSMLTDRADALLEELQRSDTTGERLRSLMASALHRGDLSADACASQLGMSRQTLYRRLKAEDLTYRGVLDKLRMQLATEYLNGGKSSINEIAYLLGFSDAAAFSKAFSRWTGTAPGEYRRAHSARTPA